MNQGKFVNFIPVIIVSVFIVLAIVVFRQKQVSQPSSLSTPKSVNQSSKSSSSSPQQTPTPTVPQGWEVYKNDQYRFSLAHPPQTEVIKHMEGNPMSIDGFFITGFERSLWVYKTDCDETCFQNEIIDWWPKTKLDGQPITINGNQGYVINFDSNADGDGPVRKEVYLRSDQGTVVFFVFPYLKSVNEPLHENQQKILDSFTFF